MKRYLFFGDFCYILVNSFYIWKIKVKERWDWIRCKFFLQFVVCGSVCFIQLHIFNGTTYDRSKFQPIIHHTVDHSAYPTYRGDNRHYTCKQKMVSKKVYTILVSIIMVSHLPIFLLLAFLCPSGTATGRYPLTRCWLIDGFWNDYVFVIYTTYHCSVFASPWVIDFLVFLGNVKRM